MTKNLIDSDNDIYDDDYKMKENWPCRKERHDDGGYYDDDQNNLDDNDDDDCGAS